MNWKEMFERWDELSEKSHEELVEIMGEAWANTFEEMKAREGCKECDV